MTGLVLNPEDTAMDKTDTVLALMELRLYLDRYTINKEIR